MGRSKKPARGGRGKSSKKAPRRGPGPIGSVLGFAVKAVVTIAIGAFAIAGLYALIVAEDVVDRFEGRRWKVPSRVYSDNLLIYPGQGLPLAQLTHRLDRLGYRRTSSPPKAQGQYHRSGRTVTAYLRKVRSTVIDRPAMRVRFVFANQRSGGVSAISDLKARKAVPFVELEPEEVMQVFGEEHQSRQLVSIDDVPPALIDAVLAAEDAGFYDHFGVDFSAIVRAFYVNVKAGGIRQGGSTLTQQLAKSFFLDPSRTVLRKLKELVIAVLIESNYDKKTILEIYLNEIYLGQRGSVSVHGFAEAARFYFGRPVERLTPAQCATLAGMIRGPNLYSPHKHPKRARERRDRVLRAMFEQDKLDEPAFNAAVDADLETVPFTAYKRTAPFFFDYLASQLATMYPQDELTRLGLSLYTTLDVGVQEEAERALADGLRKLEKAHPELVREDPNQKLQGAIVVLEPSTGHVIAMVGGRDYGVSQFNRVTQALRQPGSAFKPFAYLTGLETYSLTDRISNEPKTYRINGKRWRPRNYGGGSGGTVTVRDALVKSMNIPTVHLAEQIGLSPIIGTARRFGITTPMAPELALVLGAFEVYPLELAVAYAAFAHDGVLPHPLSLRKVVTDEGKVVQGHHLKIRSVTTPGRAYMVSALLQDVVLRGTARSLKARGIDFPVAGKTGTTNDYRDAWFVGYTPEVVALVWVGFDDQTSIKLPASKAALPIWADLMRNIGWRTSKRWFAPPESVTEVEICTHTGLKANSGCPKKRIEVFDPVRAPTETCSEHQSSMRRFLDALGL